VNLQEKPLRAHFDNHCHICVKRRTVLRCFIHLHHSSWNWAFRIGSDAIHRTRILRKVPNCVLSFEREGGEVVTKRGGMMVWFGVEAVVYILARNLSILFYPCILLSVVFYRNIGSRKWDRATKFIIQDV